MLSYTLAPEAQYPQAINECWQAYRWILDNLKKSLGISPKKILLSGDSAGGKIATSLAGLSICHGVRVPDGLVLTYPILLLSNGGFMPSRINTFDDQILSSLLKDCCYEAY